ncbi:hypothetical protein Pmani_000047 [Petrolisthes manimaculis]|uniref:C2H2-type domain-containing protein n=1 Tax=Petrolisthes manimaculis TaxID=1843537 RepID=A0AAE1UT62_9EUCA|nr:hypothetical protein Pmani_000047 [Petrolisthes manimaculis]
MDSMCRKLSGCKDDGRSTLVKCKECNEAYPTLNNYREHLLVQHHIEAHKTHHEFTSEKASKSSSCSQSKLELINT